MIRNKEYLKIFNNIYDNTYKDVSKYVVCNCNNIDDVNDIIQSIYLDVFKLVKKNKDISISYIIGISKYKIKDYYRFKYKDNIVNNEENLSDIPSNFNLEDSLMNKYDSDKVWEYLKNKNIIIFKVFYLYYYLGLSLKEIGSNLKISESNVKHYLYRTLKELNKYLESDGE